MLSAQKQEKSPGSAYAGALAPWFDLDYTGGRGRRRRFRWRSIGVVVLLCLAGLGLASAFGGRRPYQAGPVATAHNLFGSSCSECHAGHGQVWGRLWPGSSDLRSVRDDACLRCHDGPIHNEQARDAPACASCHHEHQAHSQLARMADGHCIACHKDLQTVEGEPRFQRRVTDFFRDHPPFGKWRPDGLRDPGTLSFSHQKHLGLRPEDFSNIKKDVTRLQQQTCSYCHQAVSPRVLKSERLDVEERYLEPINYERHCAACHPLSIRITGHWQDKKLERAAEEFAQHPAPHREPAVVRAALRERYLRFVQDNPVVLGTAKPKGPIPGPRQSSDVSEEEWIWARDQVRLTEQILFTDHQLRAGERMLLDAPGGCRLCHQVEMPDTPLSDKLPVITPIQITDRWFPHSRFSHEAHRLVKCTECHAAADSDSNKTVLMPSIETCRQCHAPAAARTDCVECHRYHDHKKDCGLNGLLQIHDIPGIRPAPADVQR